jgi:hypothetical protein
MNELFILSVIDVTKVKWFIINYDEINTSIKLINYLKNIFNNNIIIEYEKKNIKYYNLDNIISKNPNRISIKIFTY